MDEQELLAWVDEVAMQCPGAELGHPFGPDYDVCTVRGKMFLMRLELRGEALVNLKVEPHDGQALRDEHPEITPGYHMNKRHWVSVRAGEGLSREFVRELVVDSYRLVVEKLPRRDRPVDPETYGS